MLQRPISSATAARSADRVDVDFSLAIHNRTGKYFIGRDLLETEGLPVGDVYYWIARSNEVISGLRGRVIGRLQLHHITGHALGGPMRLLPRRTPRRPLLHLDPFTIPSTLLRPCDAVLCHDLGHLTHPELFEPAISRIYRPIFDEIAQVGPHLIFVSKASQDTFFALYPDAKAASSRVIYPAIRAGATQCIRNAVPAVSRPFLLTVGSIGERKNQLGCIEAFARSGLARSGWQYVLCGPREPGAERVEAAALNTPGVLCLPYVGDAELSWLYAEASGFVLVSRLEGFGMPVAEAIAAGLIPIVTRDSVLAEVAGPGAMESDAGDIDGIAAAMAALAAMDGSPRAARLKQLRRSIRRFDIDKVRNDW
jgi:glycosyltransferase involved in cell wall biosynthesis